jgi:hypothetical protein
MSEKNQPFVVNDRRKFNLDGELREPSAATEDTETPAPPVAEAVKEPEAPEQEAANDSEEDPKLPPPPTAEEIAQVKAAYDATTDRLDTMVRAANPGGDHMPPMDFGRFVQSLYMSAMMQLGAGTPPGEQPRVDILGARQSVDMLAVLEERTTGSRSEDETTLLSSALFELRMAFLEITQALARQAQSKSQGNVPVTPGAPGFGPKIVR